jgi:hypothetical protein
MNLSRLFYVSHQLKYFVGVKLLFEVTILLDAQIATLYLTSYKIFMLRSFKLKVDCSKYKFISKRQFSIYKLSYTLDVSWPEYEFISRDNYHLTRASFTTQ